MSADNGIYILENPSDSLPEYRVALCQAIENLEYYPEGSFNRLQVEYNLFYDVRVFNNINAALDEAQAINTRQHTEYGIVILPVRKHYFPSGFDVDWSIF